MEKIRIGTCVPGQGTEQLLPHFIQAGFECVGLNFHMVFTEKDLPTYAEKVKRLLDGSDMKVSSIGYYCNALQNEEQRKTLEQFIDNAHLFGTNLVTTFAGATELVGRVVASLLFVRFWGFTGICTSNVAAWIAAVIFLVTTYTICMHREKVAEHSGDKPRRRLRLHRRALLEKKAS